MRRLWAFVAAVAVAVAAVMVAAPTSSAPIAAQHYTVEAGETYRSIAAKFGLSETALACANRTGSSACPAVTDDPGVGRIVHLTDVAAPTTTTTIAATTTTAPATTTTSTTTTTIAPTTTTQPPTGVLFTESFTTPTGLANIKFEIAPPAPTPPGMTFMGDHDAACGNPFTYRVVNEGGGMNGDGAVVWWCNGHFMTGMNTLGYITVAMSPGPGVIFPATATKFCWDQSITNLGGRKWLEATVVSDDRYLANGGKLDYQNPGFAMNAAPQAVQLSGDDFMVSMGGNAVVMWQGQTSTFVDFFTDKYAGSTTDKATRFQTCIRDNGNGTVTRTQARPSGAPGFPVSTVTGPGSFPAGPRVFILEDVTYNADKDQPPGRIEQPYTWHLDNFSVTTG